MRTNENIFHFRRITSSELTIPSVITWRGSFYLYQGKRRVSYAQIDKGYKSGEIDFYRQCRGAALKDIIFVGVKDE
ncbi:hypothetical protein [Microcoleus sp. herbarium14]|uniref:hypothetical protein n=1 Tax=Microcoleus sp. herbarium14 TaxID=3055439 RepID=UPI002FD56F35